MFGKDVGLRGGGMAWMLFQVESCSWCRCIRIPSIFDAFTSELGIAASWKVTRLVAVDICADGWSRRGRGISFGMVKHELKFAVHPTYLIKLVSLMNEGPVTVKL